MSDEYGDEFGEDDELDDDEFDDDGSALDDVSEEDVEALEEDVDVEALERAFRRLRRRAAPGVDGMTVEVYAGDLEANLRDLCDRLHGARRVTTRLDGLFRDGLIDQEGYDRACAFRRDYKHARGYVGGSPLAGLGAGQGGGSDREHGVHVRFEAERRLQRARARLGAHAFQILILCVVDDWSWPTLARRLNSPQLRAKKVVANAIARLPHASP